MTDTYFIMIPPDGNSAKVYVRHATMVASGVSENSLKSAKLNKKCWAIDDPADKRRNLYAYDDMPEKYRNDVREWLEKQTGIANPYEYMALQPIRNSIIKDEKAEQWFVGYEYQLNGAPQRLKPEQVERCTRNASMLNMLLRFKANKREMKKRFGIDWLPFVDQVINVIKADRYSLPTTYRNLILGALAKYNEQNYEALLPLNLGKSNAAKVKDLAKDIMLELLSHPNQYDDQYIKLYYNEWAKKEGYAPITRATVTNKRTEYEAELKAHREGWGKYNQQYSRSVLREAPTQPLYLMEGDDNHIDWWFKDNKNNILRLKAYVVVDSYKGLCYPLGWAFSENDITNETIRLAFLMAAQHIKDLTGSYYLPHEVKTDRWGLASLKPMYESLGHYYPTPVGSKNRGWLENFFGHSDWQRSLKTNPDGLPAPNYTGHNISSKTAGVNLELLSQNKQLKLLPSISEASEWMAAHFERLRTMPIGYDSANNSRQQQWLEAWAQLPDSEKKPMSEEQFLLKLGFVHEANGGNAITKAGIQPTIQGAEYTYSVPPAYYLPNFGRKMKTIYNPLDMNRVLVTDGERVRFMAEHVTKVAGCMRDMEKGGREFLNQILAEKKADVTAIVDARNARRDRIAAAGQDAEIVLKMGATVRKELKTAAVEDYMVQIPHPVLPEPQEDADDHWQEEEFDAALAL